MNIETGHDGITGSIGVGATPVRISSTSVECKRGVTVYSHENNDNVYLGYTEQITPNSGDITDGFILYPGTSKNFLISDPNKLFAVAPSGSNTLWFISIKAASDRSVNKAGLTGRRSAITTTPIVLSNINYEATHGVDIIADETNFSPVYVGFSSDVVSSGVNSGFRVDAGNTISVPIDNPKSVYIVAGSGSTNKVWFECVGRDVKLNDPQEDANYIFWMDLE